jgi:hypothetical protein
MTMDVNGRPFRVVRLLGKGKGGYSYLVADEKGLYVLKQIHHEPCDYYQFGDKLASELRDYARLLEVGIPMPRLLDVDHGQERILKEYVDGPTVYQLVLCDAMDPAYFAQIREICSLLYENGLNIDYFPTNFVVENGKLRYIDYECNTYMDEWDFENWGIGYWSQTPQLLAYAKDHPIE